MHRVLQPEGWPRPRGYSNGIVASGRTIYVAGQIGWDRDGRLVGADITSQARQALRNILEVLAVDGARAEHVVRLTWFVTSRADYLAARIGLGVVYREVMAGNYPSMTAVEVSALIEPGALVEIEATAVIP